MKPLNALAACALLLSGTAGAAPAYNGTVKGTVNGKKIDVKTLCERSKMGKSDRLDVSSDPGMGSELKDRNGDDIVVSAGVDLTQSVAGFNVLVDGREYKFGKMGGLKLTPTGLILKDRFSPASKEPQPDKAFDVDLIVDCP